MSMGLHNIPEKTCPVCGKKCPSREGGQWCRHCGATLYSYRIKANGKEYTIWVTDEPRIKDVAAYIADRIRELPGQAKFHWISRQHMLANYGAAHLLLSYCEGNQSLAFEVVDTLYDNDKRRAAKLFGNKPRSVTALISRWNLDHLAVALARAKETLQYSRADIARAEAPQTMEMF